MKKCYVCGKELPKGDFDEFFTDDAFICKECEEKQREDNRKAAEKEMREHPEWYGPMNQEKDSL